MRTRALLLLVLASGVAVLAAAASVPAAASRVGSSWTTYGGSNARAGAQRRGPALTTIRRRWTSPTLDGAVYGEPLISGGRVYVATERDRVYALDAKTGRVVWHRAIGRPVPAADLPCGDIAPTVGVTSTMVLDAETGQLFVSAEILRHGIRHELVALRAANGRTAFTRDLDQRGWSPAAELQRAALTLAGGVVYAGFGGNYGDCGQYAGYVVGVRVTGVGPTRAYRVPTARGGAVWAPAGLAADHRHLFVSTGNSASSRAFDGGNAVVRLTFGLRATGHFAPRSFGHDSAADLDLGATAPVLLPHGRAFVAGKSSTGYLLRTRRLGGIGGEIASVHVCVAEGGDATADGLVFVACPFASMTAVRVGRASLHVAWQAPAGVSGSPTVAGGLVWSVASGVLTGLSPRTGARMTAVPTVATPHFAAPAAAEGLLVVGGLRRVEAYEGPSGYVG